MRILIATLLSVVIASSAYAQCQPDHPDRPSLVGQWNWRYTDDIHGGHESPTINGVTRTLDLRDDGTYAFEEEGVLIRGGDWCIRLCETNVAESCNTPRIVLYMEGSYPSSEWDYEFCGDGSCTNFVPGLTTGLRLDVVYHASYIRLFEPLSSVSNSLASWTTIKARY